MVLISQTCRPDQSAEANKRTNILAYNTCIHTYRHSFVIFCLKIKWMCVRKYTLHSHRVNSSCRGCQLHWRCHSKCLYVSEMFECFVCDMCRHPPRQPKYFTAIQSLLLMESAATDSTHPLAVAFHSVYTEFVTATVWAFRIVSLVLYVLLVACVCICALKGVSMLVCMYVHFSHCHNKSASIIVACITVYFGKWCSTYSFLSLKVSGHLCDNNADYVSQLFQVEHLLI